jgi:hypothetical protein
MDARPPKIAKPIERQWPPTGTPPWDLRYSPPASSAALPSRASPGIQSPTRTLSTSVSVSSTAQDYLAKNTRRGSYKATTPITQSTSPLSKFSRRTSPNCGVYRRPGKYARIQHGIGKRQRLGNPHGCGVQLWHGIRRHPRITPSKHGHHHGDPRATPNALPSPRQWPAPPRWHQLPTAPTWRTRP